MRLFRKKDKKEGKDKRRIDYKTPLEAYSREIGGKPFVMYLFYNRNAVLIPLEEEDIDKRLIKIYGKFHELNLNKSFNLTYYDPISKKILTQNMLVVFEGNFFTMDNDTIFSHYLLAYVKDAIPIVEKIETAIETIQGQLEKAKTPKDVKIIHEQISKLREYVKKLISKNEKLRQVGITSDNLITPTSFLGPKEVKHLDPETKDLTDMDIEEIYESLYGGEKKESKEKKEDK